MLSFDIKQDAKEIWSVIPYCNNRYQASNLGRIKSIAKEMFKNPKSTAKDKIMTLFPGRDGYLTCSLRIDKGVIKFWRVHRLIALTFIPNPQNKSEVNHIDGNVTNNTIENLEWVTPAENMQHAKDNGLLVPYYEKIKYSPIRAQWKRRSVARLDLEGNSLKEYPSINEAAKDGFNVSLISKVCSGKRQSHNGFKWKYL